MRVLTRKEFQADLAKMWSEAVHAEYKAQIEAAVLEEREACAKLCDIGVDTEHPTVKGHIMKNFGASSTLAAAIRARGQV